VFQLQNNKRIFSFNPNPPGAFIHTNIPSSPRMLEVLYSTIGWDDVRGILVQKSGG
jgi:hypothetical protein